MKHSVIIDGLRSPIGLKNGNMMGMRSDDLSAQVVSAVIKKNKSGIKDSAPEIIITFATKANTPIGATFIIRFVIDIIISKTPCQKLKNVSLLI